MPVKPQSTEQEKRRIGWSELGSGIFQGARPRLKGEPHARARSGGGARARAM